MLRYYRIKRYRAYSPHLISVVLTAVVIAAIVAGCDTLGGSGSSQVEVSGGIIFKLDEMNLHPETRNEPRLVFSMMTEEIYPCVNYGIRYDFDRLWNQVRIRMLDIVRPEICLTALGPAGTSFELPLATGRYDLVLINGSLADIHTVTVSDSRVVIESRSTTWSRPEAGVQWRFPRQSFGFYCGTLVETKDLCTDFEAVLQDLDLTPIPVPDFGRWPYLLSSSGHYYNAPAKFYQYPGSATWEEVKERLRSFTNERLEGQQGVGLYVQNWRGDAERSWMVDPP